MKKLITICFVSVCTLILFGAWVQSDNGIAGRTNSPGETTCTGCHSTYPLNSGNGGIYATSTMTNWQYVPGQTYTMNVIVHKPSIGLFGFGTEILSGNNNAGTLIITNAAKTTLKTKTVSGVSRNNVVHTFNGGLSTDSMVFSFNWTAPATNIGTVTMYYAGIAANNNGSENGDYVYTGSTVISPMPSAIQENNSLAFSVSPVPAVDFINVAYSLTKPEQVTVKLISMDGKYSNTLSDEIQNVGNVNTRVNLPAGLPKGNYIVELNTATTRGLKKIVVQ